MHQHVLKGQCVDSCLPNLSDFLWNFGKSGYEVVYDELYISVFFSPEAIICMPAKDSGLLHLFLSCAIY